MNAAGDSNLKPLPTPDADSALFWEGVRRGKLLLQHCRTCGHIQYYQQAMCRACGSEDLEHRAACGRGRVHSFSVVHRAPGPAFAGDAPYAVLLVELAEGPRMISALAGGDPAAVDFDQEVELVCVEARDGVWLPYFRMVAGGET